MGDEAYSYPVFLRWGDDPDTLKKLKNKLLLYFQNRSKSNGGECEIRDTDCSRGLILIHFRDRRDRDGVLQKVAHQLTLPGGKKMRLDVRSVEEENRETNEEDLPMDSATTHSARPAAPEAQSPRVRRTAQDPPPSLLLIENLQDSYSNMMLNLLLENLSEKSEDTDFNVERIPEIQSAVVTFMCDIDIENLIENFSRSPRVRASNMTAKILEETRTIRVEGLPPNTPDDYISLYFENPKYGVPGSTDNVSALPDEGAALVTFSTVEAAKIILGKKHQFGKKEVSVFPYYPSQDIVLYGKRRPQIQKPEPLTFPVSPYILEFILGEPELKESMEEIMRTHTCEMRWPDPLSPQPAITLCFPDAVSTHLRTLAKLVPTWKDQVQSKFSLVISKYKVVECKMDRSAWEAVREHSSSPTYSGVLIKPHFASSKVFLAGLCKDVTRIHPSFTKLVEESMKRVERKSRSQTETLAMSAGFYHIMCNSGLKRKILDQVPELKMDYDGPREEIRLSGLKEEVLAAKCEILTIKQDMKWKSVPINRHLVQFLKSTDNEELSALLFGRHGINALLEIEDDSVKLTAHSSKDLAGAEQKMSQELLCQQIFVEDVSVLRSPEWRSLHSYLLETFNVERSTILVLEEPAEAKSHVVIAGLSPNVQQCLHNVGDFLEKNTPMEKTIKVQRSVVMQFLREEKKRVLDELKDGNVSVVMGKQKICVRGAKLYVMDACTRISAALALLHSDTLCIDKPGAKKLYLANEELYVTMARNKFTCLLRLQKEEEEDEEMEETQCRVTLPNGDAISVHRGDLCRLSVDVVVNAANEDLKHVGGLALALLTAAGQSLQDDCDDIIKTEGRLSAGEAVITASGKLPCKQVIHAVGPRWDAASPAQCEGLLRKAIMSSLGQAEEFCHTSIAIPAVSSGIFGFPVEKSAENIVKAVKEYMKGKEEGDSTIKDVHLVDTNDNTVRIFASALKKEFGEEEVGAAPKSGGRMEEVVPKEKVCEPKGSANQMMTKENLVIGIREGLIQDATTDVVVNSVGKDLQLSNGKVSQALLMKAGNELQKRVKDAGSGVQLEDGSLLTTEAFKLACKQIIHVVVPHWDGGKGSAEKIFRDLVTSCLCESEKNKWRSLTFPAIGTGVPGFPKRTAASFLVEEILKFSSKVKPQHLREVTFTLHPLDTDTIREFSKELSIQMTRGVAVRPPNDVSSVGTSQSSQAVAAPAPGFFGAISSPMAETYEMKVGSVTYQVKCGDITKEDTDVIVNSTDRTFTMTAGVSGAVLGAAGQSVVDECSRLGSQCNGDHIVTQSGNLRCSKILHKIGANSPSGVKGFMCEALAACAQLEATSVAFPAIGTGMGKVSAAAVADAILESLADFGGSPQTVQTVKVVIFQKQMLNDFHSSMKRKEGGSAPRQGGILSKVRKTVLGIFGLNPEGSEKPKVYELRENIEPAVFHLCAESRSAVDAAKAWLSDLILKEQFENVITDDWIREFSRQEDEMLARLQEVHQVTLTMDSANGALTVLGLSRDVLEVSNHIQAMIKAVRDHKTREREAQLCSNLVEWGYLHANNFIPFDKMTNLELEKAKNEERPSVAISINGAQYTAAAELLIARDAAGKTLTLQRNAKHGRLEVPNHWAPMQNNVNVLVVPLSEGSAEYAEVEAQFRKSVNMRIIKIERIQNRQLWINYQIKKQSMDDKNGSAHNEKLLFHGLDGNTADSVNHNGFNRSFAGKNAACYGNGTYFAVNANYSAHDTYSRPDGSGYKYMYLCCVLTGVSCVGKQGWVVPPAKDPANPSDLYDSLTDNAANPAMYVIFHDIQAYPKYLITFTK